MKDPQTLQQAIQYFSDYENCREFMVALRWPDGTVRCPQCGSERVIYLANARLYKCNEKHPRQKFSLKVGTVFEDSPIPLEKWLPAVWLLVSCKNGVSSYELHRALGVTQKSAWFMLHRIRMAMQSGSFAKFGGGDGGEVEVDETFIGGKLKNMHARKRNRIIRAAGGATAGAIAKTVVMGFLDRQQRQVRARVVRNTSRLTLQGEVLKNVEHGSSVYTDQVGRARPAMVSLSVARSTRHGSSVADVATGIDSNKVFHCPDHREKGQARPSKRISGCSAHIARFRDHFWQIST